MADKKKGSGKGDKPRNCHTKNFKKNYDKINWKSNKKKKDK